MASTPGAEPANRNLTVDAGRLWAGGVAVAAVAALVAVVGVVVAEGVLDVDMVSPPLLLEVTDSFRTNYAITAALLALAATGLGHILTLTTPQPTAFFGWIVGLVTVVGVASPFAVDGTTAGRIATALVNLVLGLAILSLVSSVLARTVHVERPSGPYA